MSAETNNSAANEQRQVGASDLDGEWPNPIDAAIKHGNFHVGYHDHILSTCGPHTGHTVSNIAFCVRPSVAKMLSDAVIERPKLIEALKELADYVEAYEWGRSWAGRPHAIMDKVRAALDGAK